MSPAPGAVPGAPPGGGTPGLAATALALAAVLGLLGCVAGGTGGVGGAVELARAIPIPPNSAHTSFQGGRQVGGVSSLAPYCELEIQTVSEEPQEARPGRYLVRAARFALLKDATTRVPAAIAGFGCSDPLYRESVWLLRGPPGGNLHSLRCIRPGFHCRVPLPIELAEVPTVTGPSIAVSPGGP
jgi:hypothetical protein